MAHGTVADIHWHYYVRSVYVEFGFRGRQTDRPWSWAYETFASEEGAQDKLTKELKRFLGKNEYALGYKLPRAVSIYKLDSPDSPTSTLLRRHLSVIKCVSENCHGEDSFDASRGRNAFPPFQEVTRP